MGTCKTSVSFIYLGVLMFLFFRVSDVSSATDTIYTNQPLPATRLLVSSSDTFEFGLFYQDLGSGNGGWYTGTRTYTQVSTRTIVWVANREYFSLGWVEPSQYVFMISNGNLFLGNRYTYEANTTIWSTGVSHSRNEDVQAVLLDNGNLVLRNGSTSSATVLWQSFDHPTDTWFPGEKLILGSQLLTSWATSIDPSLGRYTLEVDPFTNNSLVIVWNGSMSYWSSGPWDDRLKYFTGLPDWGIKLSFELNQGESYISYSVDPDPDYIYLYHLLMDVSGRIMLRYFSNNKQTFTVVWSHPENICDVYNYCGSFGICNVTEEHQPCRCVPGFKRAINNKYDSNYLSGGCIRETELECGKRNSSFLPIGNTKLATDPTTLVLTPNLTTRCISACLANCFCNAYAYDGNKCLMWTKVAFNLQQLEFANEGYTFFLRVAASNITTAPLNITTAPANQRKIKHPESRSVVLPVVLSSVLVTLLVALSVGLYCCFSSRRRKRAQRDENQSTNILGGGISDEDDDDGKNMCYLNLHDIMVATNAFSEENKLGEGGFGPVYKGKLQNGIDVAIKRLSKKSSQGLTEFKNEVVLIIKLQHKNLVRLLGYCVEEDEKLLVYEYLSNKSLDVLLFDSEKGRELDWETRMKVVNGTTRGLQYLHEDSRLRIIHRDLKASNILLDDEMNPKISDFGTARIFACKQINDSTQRIIGTFGYMSPEYAFGGMISEKSDIYSFGVLLLEIISGKKATRFMHNDQKHSLVSHAWESWCETKGVSIIDEALCGSYSLKEVMRCVQIALLCVQDHPNDRPTISQIVYMLSNDYNLPIPKQPTFSNVLNGNQQLVSSDCGFSVNEVTQTELEAR